MYNKNKGIFILIFVFFIPNYVNAAHMVQGYFRHNGAYVAPHMSMDPGESKSTEMSYHHNVLTPNDSTDYQQRSMSPILPSFSSDINKQTNTPSQDSNTSKVNNTKWRIYY